MVETQLRQEEEKEEGGKQKEKMKERLPLILPPHLGVETAPDGPFSAHKMEVE